MLRNADCEIISLVTQINNKSAGHIMFSPVYIYEEIAGRGPALLSVLSDF